jgi:hypothetical protein
MPRTVSSGADRYSTQDAPIDDQLVICRLEEAGAALLALPSNGWTTKLRTSSLEIVRATIENYGWSDTRVRPAVPSAATITRMDEALSWITLIPLDRYVIRRIVGARSLVSPTTDRHLYPWRRLAVAIGADHKAVQRWHRQGIDTIVAALTRGSDHTSGR